MPVNASHFIWHFSSLHFKFLSYVWCALLWPYAISHQVIKFTFSHKRTHRCSWMFFLWLFSLLKKCHWPQKLVAIWRNYHRRWKWLVFIMHLICGFEWKFHQSEIVRPANTHSDAWFRVYFNCDHTCLRSSILLHIEARPFLRLILVSFIDKCITLDSVLKYQKFATIGRFASSMETVADGLLELDCFSASWPQWQQFMSQKISGKCFPIQFKVVCRYAARQMTSYAKLWAREPCGKIANRVNSSWAQNNWSRMILAIHLVVWL